MDSRIDAYIEKSAEFAKPILQHLRRLVHTGCPGVEETLKWSFPYFVYKGENLCYMASFKQHCTFGFWKYALLDDPKGHLTPTGETAMGHLGRIARLEDIPPDEILIGFIKQAARLNEEKVPLPQKAKPAEKKELAIPDYFLQALEKNPKAKAVFEKFSYSHQYEYLEWVTGAKTEATRLKRLETTMEWLAEGKGLNWKYERKK